MASKNKKIKICLIFGGRSEEHEVSLQSAKSVYEALDKNKYEPVLVGIDKNGAWFFGEPANYLLNSNNPKLIKLNKSALQEIKIKNSGSKKAMIVSKKGKPLGKFDIAFPLIHGPYGEDGKLQGFLDMLGVPYVGSGVLGSAIGMDKDVMKRLLRDAGLRIARFLAIKQSDALIQDKIAQFIQDVGYPIFVKPANLGSSVGVSKVKNNKELHKALKFAFQYDKKILIEEFIKGREIEISVLGGEKPEASLPGEVIPTHEFYSYEAKYIDENGAILRIPAELPEDKIIEVKKLAIQVFQALEALDFARIDFFYTSEGIFVVNEINTIPGFTKISMYPKLWEASGINYEKLLDKLITIALKHKTSCTIIFRS